MPSPEEIAKQKLEEQFGVSPATAAAAPAKPEVEIHKKLDQALSVNNGQTITTHPVWTSEECEQIAATVRSLRAFWIDRGWFYTLGAGTYVDDPRAYSGIAAHTNVLLENYFYSTEPFQKFHDRMVEILGAPIAVVPAYALPGFHIFDDSINGKPGGSFHIDTPYDRLIPRPPRWTEAMTFTLPVEVPEVGAGLNWWSQAAAPPSRDFPLDAVGNPEVDLPDPIFQEYRPGDLVLHSGNFYHSIAQMGDLEPHELRITLQGHGLKLADTGNWLVYF